MGKGDPVASFALKNTMLMVTCSSEQNTYLKTVLKRKSNYPKEILWIMWVEMEESRRFPGEPCR